MSHDSHNDNHGSEKKSVSFAAPLILGLVTMFIILLFTSLGDPCNECCCAKGCDKECTEACEKGGHEMKAGHEKEGEKEEAKEGEKELAVPTDNSHAAETPVKDTVEKVGPAPGHN